MTITSLSYGDKTTIMRDVSTMSEKARTRSKSFTTAMGYKQHSMNVRSDILIGQDIKVMSTNSRRSMIDTRSLRFANGFSDYSNSSSSGEFSNSSSSSKIDEGDLCPTLHRRRSGMNNGRIAFLKLLNLNPDTDHGLIAENEVEIRNLISSKPIYAQQRYQFPKAYPDHKISPLSLLCALGATVKTIKVCYNADPTALTQVDGVHGTPLHYACAYHTDKSVVNFLLSEFPKGFDIIVDKNKRNLLHVGAQYGASVEILLKLARRSPLALLMTDWEGNTPLHMAVGNSDVHDEEVIQVLMGHSPATLCTKKNFAGATPLHLALFSGAPLVVITTLVEAHERTLRTVDGKGRLPLHVAAKEGATLKIFAYLLRRYRGAVNVKDKRGRIPYEVAKKHNCDEEVLLLLNMKRRATL